MYGIIGEDDSDVETLKVLMRRLAQNPNLPVKQKGYDGCGELLNKGARQLQLFVNLGCSKFVVAYDSDGHDPRSRYEEVMQRVVRPSRISCPYCVLVPVEEIEAWILADIEAVTHVLPSWSPQPLRVNPETIPSPKEYLEKLSAANRTRPLYSHATHNHRVAEYLNIQRIQQKCQSFQPLVNFVLNLN